MKKIHITTLGCDKNTVDAQQMLGVLAENGYAIEPDPTRAEIIVVNTCCFIQAAKEESIEYILEYAGYKESGPCETLVVAGCMAERYHEELAEEMPEVDGFLGVGHIDNIIDLLKDRSRASRILAESFLESSTCRMAESFGIITAAQTTGPARGPRPTSSLPPMTLKPSS